MATILRFDSPHAADARRWALGVVISPDCRRISAAAVAVAGRGLESRPQVLGSLSVAVPPDATAQFNAVSAATQPQSRPLADAVAALRAQLAEIEASAITDLLHRVHLTPARVLAVGVHDPGLWGLELSKRRSYLSLCDAACLAERTSLNVIDAFPARDVARDGLGGPLLALPQWLLLRSGARDRLLLDLGRTIRLTLLPAASAANSVSHMLAFDVGPGMRLLDLLAERFSSGSHPFDPGGRLGVQGHRIGRIIQHWLDDPYFQRPLPRWNPYGVDARPFFRTGMEMAAEAGWSVRDLLCSATHFVAQSIVRAIRCYVPTIVSPGDLLLAGGGQQNGMLLREIATELPNMSMVRLSDVGMTNDCLDPASVAILAVLHLDQVPCNLPAVTGSDLGRVLGRLTPGSPQNWQRLLSELTGTTPAVRPLRAAL